MPPWTENCGRVEASVARCIFRDLYLEDVRREIRLSNVQIVLSSKHSFGRASFLIMDEEIKPL